MKKPFLCFLYGSILYLFTACADDKLLPVLSVINGSGSGSYPIGENVLIEAHDPPFEQTFSSWIGDIEYLNTPDSSTSIIEMPPKNVVFEATYEDLPKFQLVVVNGTGGGNYIGGDTVQVVANLPDSTSNFAGWVGDTLFMDNPKTRATFLLMPEMEIKIEATFKEPIKEISFSQAILPLFKKRCAISGCHSGNSLSLSPFTNYTEIKNSRAVIRFQILSRNMPPSGGPLTEEQINQFVTWVEQGAKDN